MADGAAASYQPGPPPTIRGEDWDGKRYWRVVAETPFPDVLKVTRALICNSEWLEVRGRILDFSLANGRWVYEIVDWVDDDRAAICLIRYREEYSDVNLTLTPTER